MKKILILIDSLAGGGAERVLCTLLQHIDKKYDITLVPIVDTGIYTSTLRAMDGLNYIPLIPRPKSNLFSRLKYKLMYKLVNDFLPLWMVYSLFIPKGNDIEIAFCEGFVTKLLAQSTNKKAYKITWLHTDLMHNNWPLQIGVFKSDLEQKLAYQSFDRIIGVSKMVCENVVSKYGLNTVSCIYNPIDREKILSMSNEQCGTVNDSGVKNISVGRLTHVKGFKRLIIAVRDLIDKSYDVRLTIIGDGEQKNELVKMINNYNLAAYITLTGFVTNPYKYMNNADLFVCSSISEGFSLAIIEAMILGLPILSTDCQGPTEILENGKYGMVVANNRHALLKGLTEMIENHELRDSYRVRSRMRAPFFELKQSIGAIESLFDKN